MTSQPKVVKSQFGKFQIHVDGYCVYGDCTPDEIDDWLDGWAYNLEHDFEGWARQCMTEWRREFTELEADDLE